MSRQEADQLLLSLEQLEQNEAYELQVQIAKDLYDKALSSVLNDVPVDIKTFLVRERLIGAASELKRFLDQPATMRDDLNQQIENQNDE